LINRLAEHSGFFTTKEMFDKMIVLDYQPTCENILIDIAKKISTSLPSHIQLHSARLYETATSYSEWFSSDNS
jgi:6-pyruvoyltetrahydropterin/6-carboxytetrahydropterin synthase